MSAVQFNTYTADQLEEAIERVLFERYYFGTILKVTSQDEYLVAYGLHVLPFRCAPLTHGAFVGSRLAARC